MSALASATARGPDFSSSSTRRVHRRVEVLLRHRRADQPDLQRAHRLEALAGEEQLARRRLADLGHHVGRDHGGQDAQAHLGEAELRAQRGHRDVAGRHQPRAAAQGRAVHARHHRLGRLVDGEEEVGQGLRLAQVLLAREAGHGLHPLQVGPGAEGGPAAAEHDHAHGVHGAQVEERLAQLGDHQPVEGVARRRAGSARCAPPARRTRPRGAPAPS